MDFLSGFLIHFVWVRAREFAFLRCSQVMMMVFGAILLQKTILSEQNGFFRHTISSVVNIFAYLANCLPLKMNYKYCFSIVFKCFNFCTCNNDICWDDAVYIYYYSFHKRFFFLGKPRLLYSNTSFVSVYFPCQTGSDL